MTSATVRILRSLGHTDFIFTTLAEEFGFLGGLVLLALYTLIIVYGFAIALRCRHQFGRPGSVRPI